MSTNQLPSLVPGRVSLVVTPDSASGVLFDLVARLALHAPLYILDCGNTFQGYRLARSLHRQTAGVEAVMKRIMLSRAFTCYQVETLLCEEAFAIQPILVLDFLATFYDQNVRAAERRRLLNLCVRRLQELGQRAPVGVWVRQRALIPEESAGYLQVVQNACGQVWQPERLPAPAACQPALF
jgi:hypothetical protein